ncbi:MAG: hypothetical protein PVG65_03540, partial [Candidatus Thorarchaeota archaeon]
LNISMSSTTKDYISFNAPTLNIQISNMIHKVCILSYDKTLDFEKITQEMINYKEKAYDEKIEIVRNYNVGQSFTMKCFRNQNNKSMIKIIIRNNETDFSEIVIPSRLLKVISKITSQFVENYINITDSLVLRVMSYQLAKFDKLIGEVKAIQSRIEGIVSESKQSVNINTPNIDDFSKFVGTDLENVKIPEIEEDSKKAEENIKPKITEVNSIFVEKVLENDLHKLESIINVGGIDSFFNDIKQACDIENLIDGITDEEWNRLVYFTKLFTDLTITNAVNKNGKIPEIFPSLKFNVSNPSKINLEIAYDLFLFSSYIRTARKRLENKHNDIFLNLGVMYLKLRVFSSPLVYSFIFEETEDEILPIILNRFEYYKNKGVFKYYENKLTESNCGEITKVDITTYVKETYKNKSESRFFNEFYLDTIDKFKLRLGTKNNLNLEQIINEVVPLEIKEKMGQVLTDDDLSEVSIEVKDLFISNKKSSSNSKEKVNIKKLNPIQMYIKTFKDDIPEEYHDKLMSFLEDYKDKKINFDNFPFPIEHFGEFAIKGLYFWDPEKYKNASALKDVIDDPMSKELILVKINSKEDENKDAPDFSGILNQIEY